MLIFIKFNADRVIFNIFFTQVILLVGILCAALAESKPVAWKQRYHSNNSYRGNYRRNYGRNYGRSYSSGGGGPNQLLKQ